MTAPVLGVTHRVYNQVEDLVDIDAFTGDRVASFALRHYGASWATGRARELAATVWSADTQHAARLSHRNPPSCARSTAPGTASTSSSSTPPTTS